MTRDPLKLFDAWLRAARRRQPLAEAMCLSTTGPRGRAEGRMVLLKDFDASGFVFYTNLHSPKARSMTARPWAALTFYWETLRRQVRIAGRVRRVSDAEADAYFSTRPRDSQLGAWASPQSAPLRSRAELLRNCRLYKKKFAGKAVPRPAHWHGFKVQPARLEFWQERPSRMHDRWDYVRRANRWSRRRLAP